MHPSRLRALLLGLLVLPVLAALGASAPAQGVAVEWQDGKHDEDTLYDCWLERPRTGVSADAGWRPPGTEVPEVGETFYIRGYAGLVGLPCSGTVAVLPEILLPAGVEWADDAAHPVRWALTKPGETQQLRTDQLGYFQGSNGGVTFEVPGGGPWILRQGYVLEIQVPVRATRELKGPATQQPECEDRREGVAPCPVSQAGDHVQVAFTVGGHGGDKSYVTPYVALFASKPAAPATKAASTTAATYTVSRRAAGRAVVTVRSARRPTGRVVVLDRGRRIGTAVLTAAGRGRVTVALPRLARGSHVLVTRYAGSATVKPSQSPARTVRVR